MNNKLWIEVDGKGEWVEGKWIGGKLWLHFQGETRVVETETKSFGKGKTRGKADIISPMPGKVTKLMVKPSDKVEEGQVLVVMEAMKMEYSLKAEQAGVVAEVKCQVGDQVTLGKLLVKVTSAGPDNGE